MTTSPPRFSAKTAAVLLLMMIGAAVLSVVVFSKTSLRLDEAQSLFQVSRALPGMYHLVAQDVHVPLYHTLLWVWTSLFGGDITTARYLSLVFFLATIPSVYFLGKLVFGRRAGLFAALLVTISPFMQWYGSEARMYSLLAFVTVVHQIAFVKVFKEGESRHWAWYALLSVVGVYVHYFFVFVLLSDAVAYFIYRRRFPRFAFPKFTLVALLSIASLLPWLWYVYRLGAAGNAEPYLETPSSGDLFNTYAQFLFGFQVSYLNTIIISLWPVVVLLAFFSLQKKKKTPPEAIFLVVAAVLPVLATFVISIIYRPVYESRYLIVALPALMVLFAWIISLYPQGIRRVLQVGLVTIILALLVVQTVSPNTPVKEDYREAVAYISGHATGSDVVIATAPFTVYPIEYYYKGPAKVTTQPIWDRFSQGSIPAFDAHNLQKETAENTADYQHAWLVLSYDQGYNAKVKDYYDNHFKRLFAKEFSPGLAVYEYKIRYDSPISLTK